MPAVTLSRTWFAPGGVRYRAGQYDDLPDQLMDHLPASARVRDGKDVISAKEWRERHGKNRKEVETSALKGETPSPKK